MVKGANVNTRGDHPDNLFFYAACVGNAKVVTYLVKNRAKVVAKDDNDATYAYSDGIKPDR